MTQYDRHYLIDNEHIPFFQDLREIIGRDLPQDIIDQIIDESDVIDH